MNIYEAYNSILKFVLDDDVIIDLATLVDSMGNEMYAQVLVARSNAICGHIPFYASMLRPAKFHELMMALDKKYWINVLSMLEDGNTCLTEPASWNNVEVVYKLLNETDMELRSQILLTTNHQKLTLQELLT